MRLIRIALICVFLCSVCAAVIEHTTVTYDKPLKRLRGKVTDYSGAPIPFVQVEVYDNPQVLKDDGLAFDQTRARQKRVAITTTDDHGAFKFGPIPKGDYEVQFSRMGWDILSVLLNTGHPSNTANLCVELRISSGPGENKVKDC